MYVIHVNCIRYAHAFEVHIIIQKLNYPVYLYRITTTTRICIWKNIARHMCSVHVKFKFYIYTPANTIALGIGRWCMCSAVQWAGASARPLGRSKIPIIDAVNSFAFVVITTTTKTNTTQQQ